MRANDGRAPPPILQGNIGLVRLFLSGAFAGATAAGLVTPADVVKTRVQVENSRYTSIPQCAATVLREEGIAAFWKGVVPRMAVQVPNHPPPAQQQLGLGGLMQYFIPGAHVRYRPDGVRAAEEVHPGPPEPAVKRVQANSAADTCTAALVQPV